MSRSLESLIAEYRRNAIAHGNALTVCNPRVANKAHDKILSVLPLIRAYGNEGNNALAVLLGDTDPSVACWSAVHLLRIYEVKATAVLAHFAETSGAIGAQAYTTLKLWKSGRLSLP